MYMKQYMDTFRRRMLEQEISNLERALNVIQHHGYEYTIKGNQIKVLDDKRDEARDVLEKALEPEGFVLNMIPSAGTMGRLEKVDRKKGSVYIFFKPQSRTSAACAGNDYEEKLACSLQNAGLQATTAGSGHGSDLTIVGPKATMTVEVKTALGADFGQFTYQYDPRTKEWSPRRTKKLVASGNEELFTDLFNELLRDYLTNNASLPLGDERLKVDKAGKIYGLKGSPTTGQLKRALQADWFGKTDVKMSFDFERIADYYAKKGDRFIQIRKKGLYALDPAAADALNIPLFAESGLGAELRVRFKPSMGENSNTAFNVAVKIKGRLSPSPLNLDNSEDVEKLSTLLS
jgi:hypothetical protein